MPAQDAPRARKRKDETRENFCVAADLVYDVIHNAIGDIRPIWRLAAHEKVVWYLKKIRRTKTDNGWRTPSEISLVKHLCNHIMDERFDPMLIEAFYTLFGQDFPKTVRKQMTRSGRDDLLRMWPSAHIEARDELRDYLLPEGEEDVRNDPGPQPKNSASRNSQPHRQRPERAASIIASDDPAESDYVYERDGDRDLEEPSRKRQRHGASASTAASSLRGRRQPVPTESPSHRSVLASAPLAVSLEAHGQQIRVRSASPMHAPVPRNPPRPFAAIGEAPPVANPISETLAHLSAVQAKIEMLTNQLKKVSELGKTLETRVEIHPEDCHEIRKSGEELFVIDIQAGHMIGAVSTVQGRMMTVVAK